MRTECNEMTELLERLRTGEITKSQLFEQITRLHPTAIEPKSHSIKNIDLIRRSTSTISTHVDPVQELLATSASDLKSRFPIVCTHSDLSQECSSEEEDSSARSSVLAQRDFCQSVSSGGARINQSKGSANYKSQQVLDITKSESCNIEKDCREEVENDDSNASSPITGLANADEIGKLNSMVNSRVYSSTALGLREHILSQTRQNSTSSKEMTKSISYAYRPFNTDEDILVDTKDRRRKSVDDFTRDQRNEPLQQSFSFSNSAHMSPKDDGFHSDGSTKREKKHSSSNNFHTRVLRWLARKDSQQEHIKQQLLLTELKDCSFSPQLNSKSMRFAEMSRIRKGFVTNKANCTASYAASERLYQQKGRYKEREELTARFMDQQEAILRQECTFQPQINISYAVSTKVRSKYLEKAVPSPATYAAHAQASEYALKECTFKPKVNTISPSMISAHLYLKQNIFDRLSRMESQKKSSNFAGCQNDSELRPSNQTESDLFVNQATDPDAFDLITSDLTGQDSPSGIALSRSISGFLRDTNSIRQRNFSSKKSRPHSAGKVLVKGKEQDQRFRNFIERQHFYEQAKHQRLEKSKQQKQSNHRFSMNKHSAKMMANGRKGEFLERVTKDLIMREREALKKNYMSYADPHCTFRPKINQTSARRKARSIMELSRGDLLRRETAKRLVKIQMEQDEMARLTFHPQLNPVSDKAHSKLKILKSPETYLQRVRQQIDIREKKQRNAAKEKEAKELTKCTFHPSTIQAPAYVHHIAKSVSIRKRLRQQTDNQRRKESVEQWK